MDDTNIHQESGGTPGTDATQSLESRKALLYALLAIASVLAAFFVGGFLFCSASFIFVFALGLPPILGLIGFIYGILGFLRGPRRKPALGAMLLNEIIFISTFSLLIYVWTFLRV